MKRKADKEKKRAKKAITEKQEVDKELKKANQKLETLKAELKRLKDSREEKEIFRKVKSLPRNKVLSLIEDLNGYRGGKKSFSTHFFSNPEESGRERIIRATRRIDSKTGYIALWDKNELITCILVPPFPIENDFIREDRFRLDKLKDLYNSELKIGFASIHAGKSGTGLIKGSEMENFKITQGYVKGKHSKGGSSQGRFERIRENQIQKHEEKVREQIKERINDPDYLVLDGNKKILNRIKENLPFDKLVIEKSLDIGKINKNSPEQLIEQIWSCQLYIL